MKWFELLMAVGALLVVIGGVAMHVYSYGHPYEWAMAFKYAPAWTWITWLTGLACFFFAYISMNREL